MRSPIRVAVTGAAGNIGYALVYRIANGDLFGPDQPVILHMLEITPALKALEGVAMELDDCAFPLLASMVLPAPGGPIKIALCPPAAAISNARLMFSCPFTSEKSMSKLL